MTKKRLKQLCLSSTALALAFTFTAAMNSTALAQLSSTNFTSGQSTNQSNARVTVSIGNRTIQAIVGSPFILFAPPISGREFVRWTGNTGLISDINAQVQFFKVPNRDVAFTPVYRLIANNGNTTGGNNNGNTAGGNNNGNTAGGNNNGNTAGGNNNGNTAGGNNNGTTAGGNQLVVQGDSVNVGTGRIHRQGQTRIGRVTSPEPGMTVRVRINGQEPTIVDVDPSSGRFVYRIDARASSHDTTTVRFVPETASGSQPASVATFDLTDDRTGVTNLLSRVTFGATPGLVEHFSTGNRREKFNEYIRQQLSPESVDDSVFEAMNVDRYYEEVVSGGQQAFGRIGPWRIAYSAFSQRQLQEVMTQFWDNHFLSGGNNGTGSFDEVLGFREHALGSFRELLRVSSTSPIMMRYLNNTVSRRGNINENYARELLELHTVGVDGGYGPDDIIAVAKVMTGWGLSNQKFKFRPARHDSTDKYIPFLDTTIKGRRGVDGMEEGEELIDILANHPETQKFICSKLIQRFVSDNVPDKFLRACTQAWAASDGNMGKVVEAILLHPDYQSDVSLQRNKVKTPYEFGIGLVRNFAIYPEDGAYIPLNTRPFRFYGSLLNGMLGAGHRWEGTPDGVSEEAENWVSSGSLLSNFNGFINLVSPRLGSRGRLEENPANVDIDYQLFIDNAKVKTAEGVAAYMLKIATSDRFKTDELEAVTAALKGSDNIFDPNNRGTVEADIRRAMTVIALLPNTIIQ